MNNLPKVVQQLCLSGNSSHDLLIASPMPYRYTTSPPKYLYTSQKTTTTMCHDCDALLSLMMMMMMVTVDFITLISSPVLSGTSL